LSFTKISTFFIPVLPKPLKLLFLPLFEQQKEYFRAPLNPELPAEAQEIVSPVKLVIVTIVLLNVD
jgi:hypothetical protein